MHFADARTARVLSTILLFAAVLAFFWAAWHVVVTFLFAVFFAYMLDPVVNLLSRRFHISRGIAIALVYLAVFAGLAVLLLFVGPLIMLEGERLAKTLPGLYEKVASGQIVWQIGAEHQWSNETKLQIQQFLTSHRDAIINIAQDFGTRLARVGRNAWWLVLIPILAIFFLKDGREMGNSVLEIFEHRRQREFVEGVLNDVHHMLAHYIRAQLTLSVITMTVYVTGMGLLHVPYAFILGIIGGFLEFIPMVGPVLGFLLFVGIALGSGYHHLPLLVAFLGVWRGIEDYILAPRIMGQKLQLHPLAVLFGVLAGAEVAGIIGVYLSIPVMAAARIFWRRWRAFQRADSVDITEVSDLTPARDPNRQPVV